MSSNKQSFFLKLSVVVLTILIILLVWGGCSRKALLSAYKKNINKLEFTNQSYKETINKEGKKIIEQEQIILSQKDAINNNLLTKDNFKQIESQVKIKTIYLIDSIFVPYTDTILIATETENYKSFVFGLNNKDYSIYGKTKENGLLIDSLFFVNDMKITIGNKSMGFLRASKPIVAIENSNPYINTISLRNVVVKNEIKWWDKKVTWLSVGMGLGLVGTILLMK